MKEELVADAGIELNLSMFKIQEMAGNSHFYDFSELSAFSLERASKPISASCKTTSCRPTPFTRHVPYQFFQA